MSWLIGKDSDAGRDWGQEEKGMTEDEMAGWHHRLDGRESEWTQGVGDGQGSLACCNSGGHKESDTTKQLNWTDLFQCNKSFIKAHVIPNYFVILSSYLKLGTTVFFFLLFFFTLLCLSILTWSSVIIVFTEWNYCLQKHTDRSESRLFATSVSGVRKAVFCGKVIQWALPTSLSLLAQTWCFTLIRERSEKLISWIRPESLYSRTSINYEQALTLFKYSPWMEKKEQQQQQPGRNLPNGEGHSAKTVHQ